MDHLQLMALHHQDMVLHPNSKALVTHLKVTEHLHNRAMVLLLKVPLQDMGCIRKAIHLKDTLHLKKACQLVI